MNIALLDQAVARVQQAFSGARPSFGVVLGSGWRDVAAAFHLRQELGYQDIPGLGEATVPGHAGRLAWVDHGGAEGLVFQGRRHWYEGAGWEPIAVPIYLLKLLGARVVILTNSAGGIRSDLKAGDLMVIDDHINAMGVNPLVGPRVSVWGERFPDMSHVYDPDLRRTLGDAAWRAGIAVAHGTYLAVSGPAYETAAEIAAFRAWGADAVGMSTVPEAILAHAAGLRVVGLTCVTNAAAGAGVMLAHAEVLAAAASAAPRMTALIRSFVEAWRAKEERGDR